MAREIVAVWLALMAAPSPAFAQSEAIAQMECSEWVRANVGYQGPSQPQGRFAGRTYVAAGPLEHLAYALAQKKFRDQREQAFAVCVRAKREALSAKVAAGGNDSTHRPVGCTKDTDCKGVRICTGGVCVDPAERSSDQVSLSARSATQVLPDLTGTWSGSVQSSVAGRYTATLRLIQQGQELRGTYSSTIGATGTILGAAVETDSSLAITSTTPNCEGSLTGRLDADGASPNRIAIVYEGKTACGGFERGRGVLVRQ
jgi:hypothetical protein